MPRRSDSSDLPPPTRSRRLAHVWDLKRTRLIIGGGLTLGLLTGLVLWHGDSTSGKGGTGQFLFDVALLGLIVCAPLATLALAIADRAAGFLGGLFVILFGDFGYWVSTKRNGEAAKAGDANAQAKTDRWKRWQKEWTR